MDAERASAPGGPDSDVDLVVIGAGAAGLGAARAARRAGRRVCLVEAEAPGGECTHFGCIPSKTLLAAASRVAGAHPDARCPPDAADFAEAMTEVAEVVADVAGDESPEVLESEGIELITGRASFAAPHTVLVNGRLLTARRVVLATGTVAAVPPIPGLAEAPYLDNRSIFDLRERPAHLVVIGGGAIGCELAQAVAQLGSQVTVLESAARLLVQEEPEASAAAHRSLCRAGVAVHTGTAAVQIDTAADDTVRVRLANGEAVGGSHLLIALGRTAVTDGLNLATVGVAVTGDGRIETDAYLETSAPGVYAAGDCAARLGFTHVADEQGRLAAANAFAGPVRGRLLPAVAGGRTAWSDELIPAVTYLHPEIARVGLTEAQAHARYGARALVTVVDLTSMDRARCTGETVGFVKLIAAPGRVLRGRVFLHLVGMTAVAPTGGELIAEGALAMRARILLARIAQTVHAYPTWSIATRVAAAAFFGDYQGVTARPARPDADITPENSARSDLWPHPHDGPVTEPDADGMPAASGRQ